MLASDITFTVDKDGKVKVADEDVEKVTMVDVYAPHDVVISKTDINGHEIAGAQLKVTGREEGATADITPIEWVSEEGKDKTVSLKPGTYTLHEEAVPEGGVYVLASDITFTVDKDGKVKVADEDVEKVTMVDDYNIAPLKVKKTVTGNMGDRHRDYEFTITLKDSADAPYTRPVKTMRNGVESTAAPDAEGKITFTLAHNEEIEFKDLIIGTKYEVTEKDYSSEDYNTTAENDKGTVSAENADVSFVNHRGVIVDTNVGSTYGWLGAAAAILSAVCVIAIMRRRKTTHWSITHD